MKKLLNLFIKNKSTDELQPMGTITVGSLSSFNEVSSKIDREYKQSLKRRY